MRVLIVSDTHRKNENYFKALELVKPQLVIHCGDAEGSEYALSEAADCPVQIVLGNNDFFSYLPKELELRLGSFRVWVTHGHNYYISVSNEFLKQEARARGYQMVFYGHTHRPVVDDKNGILAVNPGSLSYPRQEGRKPSYALMEIDEEGNKEVTIHYLERF